MKKKKLKILMLTPYLPYPLLSGGQIRTYNLLKNLAPKHQITLFSFIRTKQEKKHVGKLLKFCHKVVTIKRRKAWNWKNILLSGLSPYPFLVSIYLSLTLRKAVKEELARVDYDLIHAETFYVMPNLPKETIPVLLVEQTIEHDAYQKFVENIGVIPIKPFLYFDIQKLRFWEQYYWKKATRLVTMSAQDKKIVEKGVNTKVDVVANGVDIEFFKKVKRQKTNLPVVLFVGNFKWLPNREAAHFLAKKIWPLIKKEIPKCRLWIVGFSPTREIWALSRKNDVIVKGDIADIRQVFSKAWVLLAPIKSGRGTRYKILEAMAAECPVVTTHLGIEGIKACDGEEVLIAESAKQLVKKTTLLLKNKQLGKKMATAARKLVKERYNWRIISEDLSRIYQQLAKK